MKNYTILFGDGAGALAIEATNEFDNLIGFDMRTDGERGSFLISHQKIIEIRLLTTLIF